MDIERVLDTWFADGPSELPDRALGEALLQIDHTRQLGAHVVPWRYSEMPILLRILVVAALMAATAGVALFASGAIWRRDAQPDPSLAPRGAGLLIGSDPQGTWVADRPAAFGSSGGEYQLIIQAPVRLLLAQSPEGQQILLGSVTLPEAGVVELGPTDRCPRPGTYRFEVASGSPGPPGMNAPGNRLRITDGADECADRRAIFAGEWSRLWTTWEMRLGQRYRLLTAGGSAIDFTVPAGFGSASGSRPNLFGEANPPSYLSIGNDELTFWIIDGQGVKPARCHAAGDTAPAPSTLDAFDEWAGSDTGMTTSGATSLTIAGLPARLVDVAAGTGCDAPWDSVQVLTLPANAHARDWAIDVGDRLVILELLNEQESWAALTPEMLAAADELIASMEISATP